MTYYSQLLSYPFSGESWFYDLTSRLHLNDVYLHLSHFYWTTLTYLGPFFLLQLGIMVIYSNPNYLIIPSVIIFAYLTEVADFLVGNYQVGIATLNYWDFNNLLTNNLNKYHPHIFYISTILCIVMIFLESPYLSLRKINFTNTHLAKFLERLVYLAGSSNLFALFLGSWWAFQEGTWGGWWNWDPSEVLGLLVLVISLVGIHHFLSNSQTLILIIKLKVGISFFILSYFFTQLNFDLVSHNFGNRFTFFFTNTLFYLESAIISSLCLTAGLFFGVKRLLKLRVLRDATLSATPQLAFSLLLSSIWIWLVVTSFLPLCNYFLWQYFHLNLLNISVNHQPTLFYLLLTLYLVFIRQVYPNQLLISSFTLQPLPTIVLTPLLFLSSPYRGTFFFHVTILVQIVLNILTNQLDNMCGLSNSLHTSVSTGDILTHSTMSVYVCEDIWRETFYVKSFSTLTPHVSYSLSTQSNINETNFFTLMQDAHSFINHYQIANTYLDVTVVIRNPYFVNLYETVLFSVSGFIIWRFQNKQQLNITTNN